MLEAALFGHDGVPGDVLDGALDSMAMEIQQAHALRGEHGEIAVGQKEDVACMVEHRRDVAGHEILVLAQPDHYRGAPARRHDLVGVLG